MKSPWVRVAIGLLLISWPLGYYFPTQTWPILGPVWEIFIILFGIRVMFAWIWPLWPKEKKKKKKK